MSVAGAQHKLLVVVKGSDLYEPVGATPSTHILKPDHPNAQTYPASAFLEQLTMRMAAAAGLSVPQVGLLQVPEPVYVIERFDRKVDAQLMRPQTGAQAPAVQRLHIIDACQLLNKSRLFKHSGATVHRCLPHRSLRGRRWPLARRRDDHPPRRGPCDPVCRRHARGGTGRGGHAGRAASGGDA
jgi:hypothetical protein